MEKINRINPILVGEMFDYELEDFTLLHKTDWNGEVYTIGVWDNGYFKELTYRPVYEMSETDESFNIIGFEKS